MENHTGQLTAPIIEELKRLEIARVMRGRSRTRAKNKRGARHEVNAPGAKRFKKAFKAAQGRRPTREEIIAAVGAR
jgi:hypothetical protein